MLAKGLRTHSLYNYAGYILSYIKIVYKPRNIPVQVKDECRLLIKIIVFIEHFNVKEIVVHGLYNSWKTFTLLYRPITVHPLCHDTAYESCGASSRGGWQRECGKVVEIDDSCFSRQKCNCSRLCTIVWVFVGVEQELGHLSCACH